MHDVGLSTVQARPSEQVIRHGRHSFERHADHAMRHGGGWRSNAPTVWFLREALKQGLVDELHFDLPDHASCTTAGGTVLSAEGNLHLGATPPAGQ